MISFEEDRKEQRYMFVRPLDATLGRVPVILCNMGESGLHIRHAAALRPGTEAALRIEVAELGIAVHTAAFVVWSRYERPGEMLPYHTGLLVPDPGGELRDALALLRELGILAPDDEPEPKSRAGEHRAPPPVRVNNTTLPAGVIALVREARRRLSSNPREMERWLARAKASVADHGGRNGHPDDALAVWQYLEHAIDIDTVAKLLEE